MAGEIQMRRRTWATLEFSVPSGCVQRAVADALMAATRHYCDVTRHYYAAVIPDDAFRVEARDGEIVFVLTAETTEA